MADELLDLLGKIFEEGIFDRMLNKTKHTTTRKKKKGKEVVFSRPTAIILPSQHSHKY